MAPKSAGMRRWPSIRWRFGAARPMATCHQVLVDWPYVCVYRYVSIYIYRYMHRCSEREIYICIYIYVCAAMDMDLDADMALYSISYTRMLMA